MSSEGTTGGRRNWARLIVYGLVFSFLCIMTVGFGPIEPLLIVIFGWMIFLARTVPQMQFNLDLVGMALFCVVTMGFGLNWFFRWLTEGIAVKRGWINEKFVWQRRWAWSIVLGLGLLFVVSMSVGGVAHQVGWMAASDEPMFVNLTFKRFRVVMDMRGVSEAVWIELKKEDGNLQAVHQGFREGKDAFATRFGLPVANFQGFAIMDGDIWVGSIIFPRDQEQRQKLGGFYQNKDLNEKVDADKLESLIQENRSKLVSF